MTFAYGAVEDRLLGLPGESLQGVLSARQFVGWYNGLPEYAGLNPDLESSDTAIIIGQGNVALDVARILLSSVEALRRTDIADEALDKLRRNRIRQVRIVGRRGPMQAAFTIKEVRELMKLPGLAFEPIEPGLIPLDLGALPRPAKRLMSLLQSGSDTSPAFSDKQWSLNFCLSPIEFCASASNPGSVASAVFEKTLLSSVSDPGASISLAGTTMTFQSPLIFRSIGYKSIALDGFREAGIPFDNHRGVLANDGFGRVIVDEETKSHISRLYCAGWVKRGPTGVIASTMQDAFTTADSIVNDASAIVEPAGPGQLPGLAGWEGVKCDTPRGHLPHVVSWRDWQLIDEAERDRGKASGRERVKFTSTQGMLGILR